MHAIILAAGVGSRLFGDSRTQPPKSLIEFDGKTLLARHIEYLQGFGVKKLTLVVGYRMDLVVAVAERCAPAGFLEVIENPMYRGGSIISMWYARETYRRGEKVLFMDADVLYDTAILERLITRFVSVCVVARSSISESASSASSMPWGNGRAS